jgi:hypothetical protein
VVPEEVSPWKNAEESMHYAEGFLNLKDIALLLLLVTLNLEKHSDPPITFLRIPR